jgi:hypothetical protein
MANSSSIVFTLSNNSTNPIVIHYLTYDNDSHITHTADYTGIAGPAGDTRLTTLLSFVKRYQYGDYMEKNYQTDTHDRTLSYTTMTGTALTVDNVDIVDTGWFVTTPDNGLTGLTVQSIDPFTGNLIMDGTYTGTPTIGGSIKFQAPYNHLIMDNTDNLQVGWQIIQNGYELADNAFITAINGTTLTVNKLPNQSTVAVGSPMLFFSTNTNHLTLNNNDNIRVGFTAKTTANAAYDDTQSVLTVVADGQTVYMSAPPNTVPINNEEIKFTSNSDLYTIAAGSNATFEIYYTSTGPVYQNYPSAVSIYARELTSPTPTPITAVIRNYITVEKAVYIPPGTTPAPWVPPPTPTYTNLYIGHGEGRSSKSYTTTVYTYADGSTITVTADLATGKIISISTTPATNSTIEGTSVISFAARGY